MKTKIFLEMILFSKMSKENLPRKSIDKKERRLESLIER